ncbi:MAG: hypothetical protein ACREJG_00700 [Candidatus Rokuibacteriota bacterium]
MADRTVRLHDDLDLDAAPDAAATRRFGILERRLDATPYQREVSVVFRVAMSWADRQRRVTAGVSGPAGARNPSVSAAHGRRSIGGAAGRHDTGIVIVPPIAGSGGAA